MMKKYFIYNRVGQWVFAGLNELAKAMCLPNTIKISEHEHSKEHLALWSARISTGVFGMPNCVAGNRGPKSFSEVLLFLGEEGLEKCVKLGFIPCSVCKPENSPHYKYERIKGIIKKRYNLDSQEQFSDKNILPFDSRRLELEEIIPVTKVLPSRFYLPPNLNKEEVEQFKQRLAKFRLGIPKIGYYDPMAIERFREYE